MLFSPDTHALLWWFFFQARATSACCRPETNTKEGLLEKQSSRVFLLFKAPVFCGFKPKRKPPCWGAEEKHTHMSRFKGSMPAPQFACPGKRVDQTQNLWAGSLERIQTVSWDMLHPSYLPGLARRSHAPARALRRAVLGALPGKASKAPCFLSLSRCSM